LSLTLGFILAEIGLTQEPNCLFPKLAMTLERQDFGGD
jgi:hypothetical protein